MPSRQRTQAHIDADRRYRQSRKRIHLIFHEESDRDLLEWLRSQVADDRDLPNLIRAIVLEKYRNN